MAFVLGRFQLILPLIAAALTCQVCLAQSDQNSTKDAAQRKEAIELYRQGKFVQALPLFESLAADNPTDYGLRESWAWCILSYSVTLQDADLRKKGRVRARSIALQAQNLGDKSQLLQTMLEIPEDGSETPFSKRKEVDDAMKAAEAEFARGNLDKARDQYLGVLALDPSNYEAALFIGDVYYKQEVYGSAGEWFSQAIRIDPNRETAYRYWGDALGAMGNDQDARLKYIEGIVAAPYTRSSWVGITNWLERNKLQANFVHLDDRAAVTRKDNNNINVTLDNTLAKDDPNGTAWISYGLCRAGWQGDRFKKEFPNEPKYRRTLKEESGCLDFMITVLKEQKSYAKRLKDLAPSVQSLIKIQEAGFLDPFVLLNRADAEIAMDYESYRGSNRETIRRYLDEFVIPRMQGADKK